MKPYFAKFLPVEGEIKEGDKVLYDGKIYETTIPDKMREPKRLLIYIHDEFKHIVYTNQPKVKLFLCSRDIQFGDKDVYLDGILKVNIDNEENLRVAKKTSLTYKVIGKILTEGIKEGQEFTEKEIEYLTIKHGN